LNDVRIGKSVGGLQNNYCYVAEAAIWNVELTHDEMAILGTGMSPLAVRPGSLVGYWPVVGRTSPEIGVVGGSMTVSGSPAYTDHPISQKVNGLYMLDYPEPTGPTLAVLNPHEGVPV
jgi:hypothetical protein